MQKHHPIQPIYQDENGTLRFKANEIVKFLLANSGLDMQKIASMDFTNEDREQFVQLIGFSLSGFGDLSFVSDETYDSAEIMAERGIDESQARIEALETMLSEVKKGLRIAVPAVFRIHPDDLQEKANDT